MPAEHGRRSFGFDHLVGAKQNRLRKSDADLPGGFQIYRQLEPCRLFEGKVRRLCAFEDLGDVTRGPAEAVRHVRRARGTSRRIAAPMR